MARPSRSTSHAQMTVVACSCTTTPRWWTNRGIDSDVSHLAPACFYLSLSLAAFVFLASPQHASISLFHLPLLCVSPHPNMLLSLSFTCRFCVSRLTPACFYLSHSAATMTATNPSTAATATPTTASAAAAGAAVDAAVAAPIRSHDSLFLGLASVQWLLASTYGTFRRYDWYHGHSSHVSNVKWLMTQDKLWLISAGGHDRSLFQARVLQSYSNHIVIT